MEVSVKKLYGCILCIIILLTGCGRNQEIQNSHESDAAGLFMAAGGEAKSYMAETWDAGITPKTQPLSNSLC